MTSRISSRTPPGTRPVRDAATTGPRTVPGWALRVAYAVVIGAVVAVSLIGAPGLGPGTAAGFGLVVLAICAVVAPAGAWPLVLLGAAMLYRLAADPQADGALATLVALVPAAHQLAAITALVSTRTRIPLLVLRPAALRWVGAVVPVEIALVVVGVAFS